jgi:threonine/homoserine/homoserine lactone efflux protein
LRGFLNNPAGMRLFNRAMALLLVVSAVYLLLP